MSRWILGFGLLGAILAEIAWRLPMPEPGLSATDKPGSLVAFEILNPAFSPLGVWLSANWWIENEYLVHYLGVTANAVFFASMGAWLFYWRGAHPVRRFGVPILVWASFPWLTTLGLFQLGSWFR